MRKQLLACLKKIDAMMIHQIRNLSVRVRILLMGVIISLVPVAVIGIASFQRASSDTVSKVSVYSLQIVRQLSDTIDAKLLSWEQYGNIIATSTDVQELLSAYPGMDENDQYLANRAIVKVMQEALKVTLDIQEPDIVTSNGRAISPMSYLNLTTSPFINNLADGEKIKNLTLEADGSYVWYTGDIAQKGYKGLIVMSRAIRDAGAFRAPLGMLLLRVDTNYLYSLYRNVDLGAGSRIWLVDTEGTIVLSQEQNTVGSSFPAPVLEKIRDQARQGVNSGTFLDTKNKDLLAYSVVPSAGWTVVTRIPRPFLNSLSEDLRKIIIIVGFVCVLGAVMVFTWVYRSIAVPLNRLVKNMRRVRQEGVPGSAVPEEDGRDEVGEVARSYTDMMISLDGHIRRIRAQDQEKAMAEFRALQSQINPHFLANTLNSVAWLAKMQNASNIEQMTNSLIHLLNSSMGRGGDLIPVRQEMENIRSYIRIQEFKYFRSIQLTEDVQEEILDCRILRFLLQPVVENAVIHGIGPKQGLGVIKIRGYADDDRLVLSVTDTGVGMTPEETRRLLDDAPVSRDQYSRIGVRNVAERIRLSYGEGCGVRIESVKDLFTTIELTLPLNRTEELKDDECTDR